MTNSTEVYSTTTAQAPRLGDLAPELSYELGFGGQANEPVESWEEYYESYWEWCFVCNRPTDHTGEHD